MPFLIKQQRSHTKGRNPLGSSTNTRQSRSRKQKSHKPRQTFQSFKLQSSINRSSTTINSNNDGQDTIKIKQSTYEKYYKKERQRQFLPNISIIQEKQSIISNNQENSLDSLNNFMINGNRQDNSVVQKSNQESSSSEITEDWTLLQKEYDKMFDKDISSGAQADYLQSLLQLKQKKREKMSSSQEGSSPLLTLTQKINLFTKQIVILKQLKKNTFKIESSRDRFLNIVGNQSENQEKSQTFNEKSIDLRLSQQIPHRSQNILSKQEFPLENTSKQRILLSSAQKEDHLGQNRLLEHFSQEQNKSIPSQYNQIPSAVQYQQAEEKGQEQFMNFYINKKNSGENQANLSLNNISKIMNVRTKQHHNKSIENQNQNQNEIKQKEDDQVVAMLENELRQNKIPEISETQENQILLKQSRSNLCLNQLQGDIQNTNIPEENPLEDVGQNKNNFFFSLQARQKWINSLQKGQKWKKKELALLSKMKKILHNPYFDFTQEADCSEPI